jgi:tRNA(Glu) U13 pseudouridine synthase TruD
MGPLEEGRHPARAWGESSSTGRIRLEPRDFCVDEILGFTASGEGPHWLLLVFTLRRGQFATVVLREILNCRDVTRRQDHDPGDDAWSE